MERNGGFVLVHVATPLEVCEQRDRKGLYASARAGVIPQFTGISDPYDTPQGADLVLDGARTSPEEAAEEIMNLLRRAGYLVRRRTVRNGSTDGWQLTGGNSSA